MFTNETSPSTITTPTIPLVTSQMAKGSLLATLTSEQRKANMVVVGVLVLIILVGLLGNALVLAAYRRRPGAVASPAILFIVVMAGLDMVSCVMSVPYEILDLMRPYSNDNVPLCQACRFLTTAISQSRGLMLLCVAWDRYLKICLPLTTYTYRHARVAVITLLALAVVLSWPQIPLNGHVTIQTHMPHVLATDCNMVRHLPAIYFLLYHGLLYLLFVLFFITYGFLYGRIFYVLWRNGWFEAASSSGNKLQESEVGGSQGTWKAVSQAGIHAGELQSRGPSHDEAECAEACHDRVHCCRGLMYGQHSDSARNTSLNEDDVVHDILNDSSVSCPCVETVQGKEEFKFTYQRHAVRGCTLGEMSVSEKKLTEDFLMTPTRRGADVSVVHSSCTRSNTLRSAVNTNTAQKSTKTHLCGSMFTNDLEAFPYNKSYSCKGGYYKEKHPKAILACQLQDEESIHGCSKSRGLHRSQTVPCCCPCENISLPLLTRYSSDPYNSLNSSISAHTDVHFETNVQEKLATFHGKQPARSEMRKQSGVFKTVEKAELSITMLNDQLFVNQSCVSFVKRSADRGVTSISETTDPGNAPGLTDMSGSAETCLSSHPMESTLDTTAESEGDLGDNSPEPDLDNVPNRPTPHVCAHREVTETEQEEEHLKDSGRHSVTTTEQCRRHSCQFLSDTSRTEDRSSSITTEGNSSQVLCDNSRKNAPDQHHFQTESIGHTRQKGFLNENEEYTNPNQQSFVNEDTEHTTQTNQNVYDENTEHSDISCVKHSDSSEDFIEIGKDCSKTGANDLQTMSVSCINPHYTTDPRRNGRYTNSGFYPLQQSDFSQDQSPTISKPCTHGTFIITKDSPIGTTRFTTPHESSTTIADRRPGKGKIRRHGGKRLRMGKTTVMLALVTLSTVICFVPFLTVIVLRTSGSKFQNQTSSTGGLVYMFCIRSFLLNNLVNPVVYFYVNPRFRQRVRGLFCWVGHRCLSQLKLSAAQSETSKSDS
ncbi:hypothetical protein ACOMHN_004440 [Nucella lapillus]